MDGLGMHSQPLGTSLGQAERPQALGEDPAGAQVLRAGTAFNASQIKRKLLALMEQGKACVPGAVHSGGFFWASHWCPSLHPPNADSHFSLGGRGA